MANETPAEKAERETQEAAAKAAAERNEAVAKAVAAEREAQEAAREADRQEFAAKLAEATGGQTSGASTSTRTRKYELLADVMHVPIDGDLNKGYVTYTRGDSVPLAPGRAQELIDAGAVKDPNAEDKPAEGGGQTKAPK